MCLRADLEEAWTTASCLQLVYNMAVPDSALTVSAIFRDRLLRLAAGASARTHDRHWPNVTAGIRRV